MSLRSTVHTLTHGGRKKQRETQRHNEMGDRIRANIAASQAARQSSGFEGDQQKIDKRQAYRQARDKLSPEHRRNLDKIIAFGRKHGRTELRKRALTDPKVGKFMRSFGTLQKSQMGGRDVGNTGRDVSNTGRYVGNQPRQT